MSPVQVLGVLKKDNTMVQFNFNPFPYLSTERLLLRQLINDDVNEMFIMRSDKETMQFVPRPIAQDKAIVLELIEKTQQGILNNQTINWVMELKATKQFIGTIGYYRSKPEHHRAEVGYMIQKTHQGKGYTTEALKEVIKYGFSVMQLHSIEAVIDPDNFASEKILQKCGFIKEAHFKENEFWEGKYLDSVVYSLLKKQD